LRRNDLGAGIAVLESVQDRLFATLFLEAGLAVGVDALLGKVVGGTAGWRDVSERDEVEAVQL
jgi:hypothetical protein